MIFYPSIDLSLLLFLFCLFVFILLFKLVTPYTSTRPMFKTFALRYLMGYTGNASMS